MSKLFTYGTLMRGYHNHSFLSDARFIGKAISVHTNYQIYDAGFPVLADDPARLGGRVAGEIYEVDRRTLHRCDRLERHPHWYKRRKRLFVAEDGQRHEAWVYVMPAQLASRYRLVETPVLTWPFNDQQREWLAS